MCNRPLSRPKQLYSEPFCHYSESLSVYQPPLLPLTGFYGLTYLSSLPPL